MPEWSGSPKLEAGLELKIGCGYQPAHVSSLLLWTTCSVATPAYWELDPACSYLSGALDATGKTFKGRGQA